MKRAFMCIVLALALTDLSCGGGDSAPTPPPPPPPPVAPTVTAINPTAGVTNGGTAVTLTGTNFVTGVTVAIGGVAATNIAVQSPTSLTAATGTRNSPGRVDVVVTNSSNQSGTLTQGYEYQVNLQPNPGGPYTADSERDVSMTGLSSTSHPFPIAFFRWICGQTPSLHRVNCTPTTPTPTFRYRKEGISTGPPRQYTVTLEIEDNQGNKRSATTTVTVRQVY